MGKRADNKKGEKALDFIVIVLGVIWLIFAFAVIIAPFVALILFLVNLIRYRIQDLPQRTYNFWLTDSERMYFKKVVFTLYNAKNEAKNVEDTRIIKGFSRNIDGQINRRSDESKELRARENNANDTIQEYSPVFDELQYRPYQRWKKARKHYSNALGFGCIVAILALLIGINALTKTFADNDSLSSASSSVSEIVDSTKVIEQQEQTENTEDGSTDTTDLLAFYGISIGGMAGFLLLLTIIWFIPWMIGRIKFNRKNPEPPLVTVDNVDTYLKSFLTFKEAEEDLKLIKRAQIKQRKEDKRQAKAQRKAENVRAAEQRKAEVANVREAGIKVETPDKTVAEPSQSAPVAQSTDMPQRSREENLFISWADALRKDGYEVLGNWDNWKNAGQWKNLAVVSSISDERLRITIEYDARSRKVYFGIAKLGDEDKVSQELLNSETFRNIITENGLTVKNNEWWYCLRFSSFDRVFSEYCELLASCRNK